MNVQKSIGYKLIQHAIGEHYADVVCDLAQSNARGMIYIPIYTQTALKLKKILPREVLIQLVSEFGGQRLYVSKKEHHRDKRAFAKQSIIQYMVNKGYSEAEIVDICGFHKKTIKKAVLAL